jgi:predicted MPP superfamily phosphohydrolase
MRMIIFIGFFMGLIGLGSFFSFSIFKLYGVFKNQTIHTIVLSLFISLPIIFITSYALSTQKYFTWNAWLNTIGSIWIGAILYFTLSAIILGVLYFFVKGQNPSVLLTIGTITLLAITSIVSYSVYNASHPVVTIMTVQSPTLAPLWKDKKIVLFSDTHLGLIRQRAFAEKVVGLVNKQNPDLVLMAGDMIDGPIIPYEKFNEPFKNIQSTYGVYYTPGNHEWYNVEPQKFLNIMKHFSKELIDEKTEINGTQIIGINYAIESLEETKQKLLKTGYDTSKPSIAMLHDPKNNDALTEAGVSLVVSGHTHCGQFWPFSAIVKKMYGDKMYGVRQLGDQATLTTCGIGTAQSPFRLGNKPEIVVIKIIE